MCHGRAGVIVARMTSVLPAGVNAARIATCLLLASNLSHVAGGAPSSDRAPSSQRVATTTIAIPAARRIRILRCVRYWGEARYRGLGYDHEVHVVNDCDQAVVCAVSTNVDPHPYDVTVSPARHAVVITRKGSPSRSFTANVACDFEG